MEKETFSETTAPLRYAEGWHELLAAPDAHDYQRWMSELTECTQQSCQALAEPPEWTANAHEVYYRWQQTIEKVAETAISTEDRDDMSEADILETALLTLQATIESMGWDEEGFAFTVPDLCTGQDASIDLRTLHADGTQLDGEMAVASQPLREALFLGEDLAAWHQRMDELMQHGAHIVALRGAGSVNGINPIEAEVAAALTLDYLIEMLDKGEPVAIIYDGDTDDRERPDIGSIFGRIADHLREYDNASCIAVQTEGWYSPQAPGVQLCSAYGTPYETFIFSDAVPGAHGALTQSDALVQYVGYEQIFVGPAGPIATEQLAGLGHLAARLGRHNLPVRIIKTRNNPTVQDTLLAKLAQASEAERSKIEEKLAARAAQPYGALFDQQGRFLLEGSYASIVFNIVSANLE